MALTIAVPVLSAVIFCSETALSVQNLQEPISQTEKTNQKTEKLPLKMGETPYLQDPGSEMVEGRVDEVLGKKPEKVDVVQGKVSEGSSLYLALKKHGMGKQERYKLIQSLKAVHNVSRIRSGTPYDLVFVNDELKKMSYEISRDHRIVATREGDGYVVDILPIEYQAEVVTRTAVIKDNLYNTIKAMGEKPALVNEITEIFAWDINFFKDLMKGDELKIVIEKKYRNGTFAMYGKLIGAEFINQGKKITAIYFPKEKEYFTPKGKSLRKQFLKAPLKFSRVSSGFSHKRFHPILKRNVPHLSVDYVAPIGTPVYAVADGTVTWARSSGPSGKLIRIKHNSVYNSAYCHLSGFAKKVKKGSYVEQGQLIGWVGMTGRTTGPHLCYHFKKNGSPINPLKFKPPKAKPVPREEWKAFTVVRRDVLEKLALASAPENMSVKLQMPQNENAS